ncbi:hypothetical protein BGX27_006166, partial [Mortierella sp. AM989]
QNSEESKTPLEYINKPKIYVTLEYATAFLEQQCKRKLKKHICAEVDCGPVEPVDQPGSSSLTTNDDDLQMFGLDEIYKSSLQILVPQASRNHLLENEEFKSPLFQVFAKDVVEGLKDTENNPLQQYEAAIPAVANEIRFTRESVGDIQQEPRSIKSDLQQESRQHREENKELIKSIGVELKSCFREFSEAIPRVALP